MELSRTSSLMTIVLVYKDFIKQVAYKYKELMLQPSCMLLLLSWNIFLSRILHLLKSYSSGLFMPLHVLMNLVAANGDWMNKVCWSILVMVENSIMGWDL